MGFFFILIFWEFSQYDFLGFFKESIKLSKRFFLNDNFFTYFYTEIVEWNFVKITMHNNVVLYKFNITFVIVCSAYQFLIKYKWVPLKYVRSRGVMNNKISNFHIFRIMNCGSGIFSITIFTFIIHFTTKNVYQKYLPYFILDCWTFWEFVSRTEIGFQNPKRFW